MTTVTTFGFDPNGNQISIDTGGTLTTMGYDKENRLALHQQASSTATYLYAADNMKRVENVDGAMTTLVWDGSSYLQGRS
jgi:hypothetical protein